MWFAHPYKELWRFKILKEITRFTTIAISLRDLFCKPSRQLMVSKLLGGSGRLMPSTDLATPLGTTLENSFLVIFGRVEIRTLDGWVQRVAKLASQCDPGLIFVLFRLLTRLVWWTALVLLLTYLWHFTNFILRNHLRQKNNKLVDYNWAPCFYLLFDKLMEKNSDVRINVSSRITPL